MIAGRVTSENLLRFPLDKFARATALREYPRWKTFPLMLSRWVLDWNQIGK